MDLAIEFTTDRPARAYAASECGMEVETRHDQIELRMHLCMTWTSSWPPHPIINLNLAIVAWILTIRIETLEA
jgi:hypothetical protein